MQITYTYFYWKDNELNILSNFVNGFKKINSHRAKPYYWKFKY